MGSKGDFLLLLLLFFVAAQRGGCDIRSLFQSCCAAGTNHSISGLPCKDYKVPPNVPTAQQGICLNSLDVCCKNSYRDSQCNLGKEDAKNAKDCVSSQDVSLDYRKDCCMACQLGIETGASDPSCENVIGFGPPFDKAFVSCCEEMTKTTTKPTTKFVPSTTETSTTSTSTTLKPKGDGKSTTPSDDIQKDLSSPSLENICYFPDVCAQICIPTPGSYKCACRPGFTLMNDGISCKIDKSILPTSSLKPANRCEINNPCDHACEDTGVSVKCSCYAGYELAKNKVSCIDIDECERGTHACVEEETCVNEEGTYACESMETDYDYDDRCPTGFIFNADKKICDDVDECNFSLVCTKPQVCENTQGSYKCVDGETPKCPPGFYYKESIEDCQDVDECINGQHDCNRESQTCLNTIGSFTCIDKTVEGSCPPGFKKNAKTLACEDINECVENQNVCAPHEECVNESGGHNCVPRKPFNYGPIKKLELLPKPEEPVLYSKAIMSTTQPTTKSTTIRPVIFTTHPTTSSTIRSTTSSTIYPTSSSTSSSTIYSTSSTIHPTNFSTSRPTSYYTSRPISYTTPRSITYTTSRPTTYTTSRPTTYTSRPITYSTHRSITYPSIRPISYPTIRPTTTPRPTPRQTSTTQNFPEIRRIPLPNRPIIPTTRHQYPPISCPSGFQYSDFKHNCVDINECAEENECDSNQDCYNTHGSYTCICKRGFQKDFQTMACTDINECQIGDHDCTDGQRCDNTIGSYLCSRTAGCGTGYTLNYHTGICEDDDECALGTHTCHIYGPTYQCKNTVGSYRCEKVPRTYKSTTTPKPNPFRPAQYSSVSQQFTSPSTTSTTTQRTHVPPYVFVHKQCLHGYRMNNRGECEDIDECLGNPCNRGQKCLNLNGSYQCISTIQCVLGYELNDNGTECVDIDECARGVHECSSTQICKNAKGYYICECPPGHYLNKNKHCEDIDECSIYRPCSEAADCRNTIGSFECRCKSGLRNRGLACDDIDECSEIPGLCQQKCVNIYGSYRCSCEKGYTLNPDNRTCTDVNECEKFRDHLLCVGTCENTPGSYSCSCPKGYNLGTDGRTCQDIDECQSNICTNSEDICINTRGGYKCHRLICPPNYVRDQDHKSRCKRSKFLCDPRDDQCTQQPFHYSYHFLSFTSMLPIVHGHIDFFQMRGPTYPHAWVDFVMKIEDARCPPHVRKVDQSYFKMRKYENKALLSIVKPIEGPQEIDVQLEMNIQHNGVRSRMIAKILLIVTQYTF